MPRSARWSRTLRRAGHDVSTAARLGELNAALARTVSDVLVSDVVLPDGNGLDHAAMLATTHPALPIIVLSARNTLTTVVRATEVGAFDYLPKPFDLDLLARTVGAALARGGTTRSHGEPSSEDTLPPIGRSPAMQEVYRVVARVVSNDLTMLITGESGTGKELVARAIHDLGPRRAAPRRSS